MFFQKNENCCSTLAAEFYLRKAKAIESVFCKKGVFHSIGKKVRKKRNHQLYKIQNHPVLCKQVERAVQKSGACTKYLTFKIKEINFGKRFCHL
jgi:hypothetical protein